MRTGRIGATLAALLVVLAGCGGYVEDATTEPSTTASPESAEATTTTATPTTTEATPTTSRTTTRTTASTTTSSTTTTATTTTTTDRATTTRVTATAGNPDSNNPWSQGVVEVAVQSSPNSSRDVTPLVRRALAYWNRHDDEYGDYEVEFVPTADPDDADLVVEFVERIANCGDHRDEAAVGCAPLLETGTEADRPETVRVVAGYSNDSTVQILKHEFGHVLGIEHGEPPAATMQALSNYTYLSRPDAANRTLPWSNATLAVYVDERNLTASERDDAHEQIRHALTYFEAGAEGHVPPNVSFVRTDNRTRADVVVSFPASVQCGSGREHGVSCGRVWGTDTDVDSALERYSKGYVRLADIDPEAIGWHVGYWLAYALGLESDEELPDPFADPGYETTHGEWWE